MAAELLTSVILKNIASLIKIWMARVMFLHYDKVLIFDFWHKKFY